MYSKHSFISFILSHIMWHLFQLTPVVQLKKINHISLTSVLCLKRKEGNCMWCEGLWQDHSSDAGGEATGGWSSMKTPAWEESWCISSDQEQKQRKAEEWEESATAEKSKREKRQGGGKKRWNTSLLKNEMTLKLVWIHSLQLEHVLVFFFWNVLQPPSYYYSGCVVLPSGQT